MIEESLGNMILELRSLRQEGSYWDFKREWHGNNSDLLHDIICFANNLVNRDCYIIIGIDEENDYNLCDVTNDANRKNTQNLVDFLKDKKFAGGIRPVVLVETCYVLGVAIDVIVIKNSHDTPFYLTASNSGVLANHIYTRVMDTNTSKNGSADLNNIEYLWKKRFRLVEPPIERIKYYLKDRDGWEKSPAEATEATYYKTAPEYRIVTIPDDRDGYEYYLFSQVDSRPHWNMIYIYYHQTVLTSFLGMNMDGARWSAIAPNRAPIMDGWEPKAFYGYYTEDSLEYAMHCFLGGKEEEPDSYRRYMETILVFEDQQEREQFERYAVDNFDRLERLVAKVDRPIMGKLRGYKNGAFEEEFAWATALNILLKEYRKNKQEV